MMSLRRKIIEAIELDEVGEIKELSLKEIENYITNDHSVSMIAKEEYDAIIVSQIAEPTVDGHLAGIVFFNKYKNSANGVFITSSRIKSIAIPIDGLKLVYTLKLRYLVI